MYYVIFEWEYYAQNPSQIINIRQGGLAIHGGLIGAVITGVLLRNDADFLSGSWLILLHQVFY